MDQCKSDEKIREVLRGILVSEDDIDYAVKKINEILSLESTSSSIMHHSAVSNSTSCFASSSTMNHCSVSLTIERSPCSMACKDDFIRKNGRSVLAEFFSKRETGGWGCSESVHYSEPVYMKVSSSCPILFYYRTDREIFCNIFEE